MDITEKAREIATYISAVRGGFSIVSYEDKATLDAVVNEVLAELERAGKPGTTLDLSKDESYKTSKNIYVVLDSIAGPRLVLNLHETCPDADVTKPRPASLNNLNLGCDYFYHQDKPHTVFFIPQELADVIPVLAPDWFRRRVTIVNLCDNSDERRD